MHVMDAGEQKSIMLVRLYGPISERALDSTFGLIYLDKALCTVDDLMTCCRLVFLGVCILSGWVVS